MGVCGCRTCINVFKRRVGLGYRQNSLTSKVISNTRQMFITSGGEPEVIHYVSIGRGLGMVKLGYLAVFLSAQIVKLYEGGYTDVLFIGEVQPVALLHSLHHV